MSVKVLDFHRMNMGTSKINVSCVLIILLCGLAIWLLRYNEKSPRELSLSFFIFGNYYSSNAYAVMLVRGNL